MSRTALFFGVASAVLLLACMLAISSGTLAIDPAITLEAIARGVRGEGDSLEGLAHVVWVVRLPRVAMAVLVGAALGASGATTQAVFRNPLADPYLLGVAAGAGLGAILGWHLTPTSGPITVLGASGGSSAVPACAFAGGLAAVALTIALARSAASTRNESLVLAGVVIGSMMTALTMLLLLRSGDEMRAVITWTLGNLALSSTAGVVGLAPYVVGCIALLASLGRGLDALQLGDDTATTLGVPVTAVRWAAIGTATLATSASIAFVGVIGFVGLVAPHLVRRLGTTTHRTLITSAAVVGATLLVLADLGARTLVRPAELPVSIVLTLGGGPVFLWVLRRT